MGIIKSQIKVITKLPNSEQSYKGKVKTHNYINRQNQSTTGNSANIKNLSQYRKNYANIDIGLFFFILAEFMILYCKDSLGCIDNTNIELINN
jgi:hypothetical protein